MRLPREAVVIGRKQFEQIRERDGGFCLLALPGCLGEGGVPDHRAGRGSGGSPILDHPANLILACAICNGTKESALVRLDLLERGLRVEKASTNAATLVRVKRRLVTYLDGERYWLISATEKRHESEGMPDG